MEVPIFKSNGTFIDYVSGLPPNNYEGIYATGTYTGNLSTEGCAISMTFVKIAQPSPDNTGSVVLVDCPDDYPQRLRSLTVSGGNLIETNDDDSQTQKELVKLSFSISGRPYLSFASAIALIMNAMLRARFLMV